VPNGTVRYFTENSYTPNKNVTKSYRSAPDIYNVKKSPSMTFHMIGPQKLTV